MADSTLNMTNDAFVRGSSNGYVADIAALGSIHNTKDLADQLHDLSSSVCAGHADITKSIDGNSFRALEQFGILSQQMEKHLGELDVLVQKTTGELQTQITLTAKDGIIDSTKNAAAATLLAHQLAAAQAKYTAECCCEMKQLTSAEANKTRDLICEIERRNSDRREADLKIDLSNCRQTAELARQHAAITQLINDRLGGHHGCCPSFSLPIRVVPCSGGNGNGNGNG